LEFLHAGEVLVAAKNATILTGVAAAAFLGPFTQTVYTPSLPDLQRFFGVNTVMINLTISLFTAILALSNFVVGPAADTWGRRAVLLPGLAVFCLGSLLCLFADSYSLFLAGRAVQAMGISTALWSPHGDRRHLRARRARAGNERVPDGDLSRTSLRSRRRWTDRGPSALAMGVRTARSGRSCRVGVQLPLARRNPACPPLRSGSVRGRFAGCSRIARRSPSC
jgi:hypothetical protein